MKKQVLNQLESLIKNLNKKNERHEGYEYVMHKPNNYARGHYSLNVEYKMVFSTDMKDFMNFALQNDVLLRLGLFNDGKPYIDFQ